jgi:hypothetical protein
VSERPQQALARKYALMLRLRTEALTDSHMRSQMRALAREFPGALRELDALPLEVIQHRLDEVSSCELPRPWMIATWHYHQALAVLLAAKVVAQPRGSTVGPVVDVATESVAERMGISTDEADDLIFAGLRRRRTT